MHTQRPKTLNSKRGPIDDSRHSSVPWFGASPGSEKPTAADHQIIRGLDSHMH